jgi:hypothetical protein
LNANDAAVAIEEFQLANENQTQKKPSR